MTTASATTPTFALLVPCRNGVKHLPRLFASAQAQTRTFDEIWLFDDGSDDGTGALAAQFGARVIRTDNAIGPAAARNRLATACQCTWLHFHDADDTMAPHYLERVASVAQDTADLVVCDMVWIDEATGHVDTVWRYDQRDLEQRPIASLLVNTIGGINGLFRRSFFLEAGGFDASLRYWEDMELCMRLFSRRVRCIVVNEGLVTAFRRRLSYSNSNLSEVWRVKLAIMRRLLPDADLVLRVTIAAEAETIATRFAALGCWSDVPTALALCADAGGDPPTTQNKILGVIKRFFPRSWAFRLQHRLRASAGTAR